MSGIVCKTTYDHLNVRLVPVIVSFDGKGHIAPLYVRIKGISYKIESFWVKNAFRNISDFQCTVIDGNCEKPLLLYFFPTENVWGVPSYYFDE